MLDGGPTLEGITLERLKDRGVGPAQHPRELRPVRRRRVSHAFGQVRALLRADEGRRPGPAADLHSAATRTRRRAPTWRRGIPLQLLSPPRPQFLNSTFANSPRHRAAAGDPTIELAAEDARSRGLDDGEWAEVYNDRGRFQARVALTGSVRPGVAVATGIYWNKLVARRRQRQQHDVLGPDRHGRRGDVF